MMSDNHPNLGAMSDEEKRAMLLKLVQRQAQQNKMAPLSNGQMRFWILDQIDEDSASYNILPYGLRIEGSLQVPVFLRAMEEIFTRHQILRTSFRAQDGKPVQEVHDDLKLNTTVLNLEEQIPDSLAHYDQKRQAEVRRLQIKETHRVFNLEQGPLISVQLLRLSEVEHVLLLTLHHIIADAWSIGVIMREMEALYEAFKKGLPSPLPGIHRQYRDFVDWERRNLDKAQLDLKLAYWKKRLEGLAPLLELPYDRPRPAIQSHHSAEEDFSLDSATTLGLHSICREYNVSLMINLMAAFKVLLACYSGSRDIAIGQAVTNRSQTEWEQLIGFFVNTVVIRSQVKWQQSYLDHLQQVKQSALEAYQHKDVPFDQVVSEACSDRSLAFSPLFQVLFALVDARTLLNIPGLEIKPLREIRTHIQFDLHLLMWDLEGGISGTLEYNTDVFSRAGIRRMLSSFKVLLAGIAAQPSARLKDLPSLDENQRNMVLKQINQTEQAYEATPIHRLIEARAQQTPKATALIFDDQQLDYASLNKRANGLALHLRGRGVCGESLVGICLPRSLDMTLALLATLKAGGAYLPLDPDHPESRLEFQISDAKLDLIITWRDFAPQSAPSALILDDPEFKWQALETNPNVNIHMQHPAYVIYTSGSTGQPKGVAISHQAICNRLLWMQDHFQLTPQDRILQKTPYSFDVSVWEFFWPLMYGAGLVVAEPQRHWDTDYLRQTIETHAITTLHFVPSMLQLFLEEPNIDKLHSIKRVICSGEALPTDLYKRFATRLNCPLYNLYGPTEAAVDVTFRLCDKDVENSTIPIGKPIDNVRVFVVDSFFNPVPISVAGELLLGGVQLARGYINRPMLTAERFVPDVFSSEEGARLYRTGDRVRVLPMGEIEYLERMDHQVKLRGFRIELGEVEAALVQLEGVREAVVSVHYSAMGDPRLVAYMAVDKTIVLPHGDRRKALALVLPDYMVPALFVDMDALPLSVNGKIDRKNLPDPEHNAISVKQDYTPPSTPLEKGLALIWSNLLGLERIGVHDRFFELGGHSLLLIQMHRLIKERFGTTMKLTDLFQYPTISTLADAINNLRSDEQKHRPVSLESQGLPFEDGIAIIGMAGRFPGASNIRQLWENLAAGVESISFFDKDTLAAEGVAADEYNGPGYVPASGVLDNIAGFDASFFGFTPREAEITDPQQRLFLECAYEALEHAGLAPDTYAGRIGVFAGTGMSTYFLSNLLSQPGILKSADLYQIMVGNDRNFPATQTSHKMNLRGPSINIANACSSSLIAVHLACKSLLEREADTALAGGMKVIVPHRVGYQYQEGNIHAPDGHCRSFDESAQGIVMSSGGGIVVLRRLKEALANQDTILAVIKGSALNNDGAQKVGFMAPSALGQEAVIAGAHEAGGIDPETITYVEAHGTGTTLGDPIEIAALTAAFRRKTDRKDFCYIGSIKTNMGHLDHAAGIAGLIKTVLALMHRTLPPSLHFQKANPAIDFKSSPFKVVTKATAWTSDGPLRAGVSSFGIGGTNAHLVLEEAPLQQEKKGAGHGPVLIPISAKSPMALDAMSAHLADYLKTDSVPLAHVAFTLQVGRNHYARRRFTVGNDREATAQSLAENRGCFSHHFQKNPPQIIFLFPGQGSQHVNMMRGLYERLAPFRETVNHCAEILKPLLGQDLRELMYVKDSGEEDESALAQTSITQPALFVTCYASAKTLDHWDIKPKAMIGHSIGEYVAATLAGVFSLEDALRLVAERGRLMQSMEQGGMLAVNKSEGELKPFLREPLDLAAFNGPQNTVISGPQEALVQLQQELGEGRFLKTSHAFHSRQMDSALAPFLEAFKGVSLSAPKLPFVSNLTGTWIQDEQACDPNYWVQHLRKPVRFSQGMEVLLQENNPILLEVGPGNALIQLSEAYSSPEKHPRFALARHPKQKVDDMHQALTALGHLWLHGARPKWENLSAETEAPHRTVLPTYTFERHRFWVEPGQGISGQSKALTRKCNIDECYYSPSWLKQSSRIFAKDPVFERNGQWLVLEGGEGLGSALCETLQALNQTVISQSCGSNEVQGFQTADRKTYESLLSYLDPKQPLNVVYLLDTTVSDHDKQLDLAFFSPLYFAQALSHAGWDQAVQLCMACTRMFDVLGEEAIDPWKHLMMGPVKVLSQEYAQLTMAVIDLDPHLLEDKAVTCRRILQEIAAGLQQQQVAHRGKSRWVPTFIQAHLKQEVSEPLPLLKNGVYLITGGLGGMGKTFAKFLAQEVQGQLILTSRRVLPPRDQWHNLTHEDAAYAHIGYFQELEGCGAKVHFMTLDVTHEADMQQFISGVEREFGSLEGIIHAAGIAGGGLAQVKDRQMAENVLGPKVAGTLNIARAIVELKPTFALFCSSTSAILGGVGQIDYCAANNFQDAMAQELSRTTQVQVVSVNWPAWQEVGMAVETAVPDSWRIAHEQNIAMGIKPHEGVIAFKAILCAQESRVVVSTIDVNEGLRHILEANVQLAANEPTGSRHERPNLAVDYLEPRDEVELDLSEIWSTFLGIQPIGVHDDFFDLGGHSLLATQIVSKIREHFGAEIQIHALFDNPTIAGLALVVLEEQAMTTEDGDLEAMLSEIEGMSESELDKL